MKSTLVTLLAVASSVTGQNTIESRLQSDTLNVHLLIYQIKDGLMAVCFAHSDDARYLGYKQGAGVDGDLEGWHVDHDQPER